MLCCFKGNLELLSNGLGVGALGRGKDYHLIVLRNVRKKGVEARSLACPVPKFAVPLSVYERVLEAEH